MMRISLKLEALEHQSSKYLDRKGSGVHQFGVQNK
jgi:hypothetical protein